MKDGTISREQLTKLFSYLTNEKRGGSFRFLIYDVMGFKPEDYSWLYSTGLMNLNNMIYAYRTEIKNLNKKIKGKNNG